jgi:hypothetical protein
MIPALRSISSSRVHSEFRSASYMARYWREREERERKKLPQNKRHDLKVFISIF